MKKYGYARVSTIDQNLSMQIDALNNEGCVEIFYEKISGRKFNRKEFNRLLNILVPGDVLVVWKVDRLGRSATDICSVIDKLKSKNISIISLTEGINTNSLMGEIFCKFAGVFAELEIANRSERTRAGIQAARKRGVRLGRPSGISINKERMDNIWELKKAGVPVTKISTITGIPAPTIYRYLKYYVNNG